MKPFIDHYSWDGVIYPASTHDCNKFERNNSSIALIVLYADMSFKLIQMNCG